MALSPGSIQVEKVGNSAQVGSHHHLTDTKLISVLSANHSLNHVTKISESKVKVPL